METINYIFSNSRNLDAIQMSVRAVMIFFVAIIFLRVSGRRSFGLKAPLDVVIAILLGGMMGRSIVGASPFFPSLAASAVLVILHRLSGTFCVLNKTFGSIVKGQDIIVFENGEFRRSNMLRCMVTEKDLRVSLRESIHHEDFEKVKSIYIERDGAISIITKQDK